MVYFMKFRVDGACRGNGYMGSIGAAACCLMRRDGSYFSRAEILPDYPTPTNQRAELQAMILALKWALEKYEELDLNPRLAVEIYSDSQYAVNCLDKWIYTWQRNGWRTQSGKDVANQDLIEEAADVESELEELGSVSYHWISRSQNSIADRCCNDALDEYEEEIGF
ncbi:ribonuclease H1 [Xylaria intraflava]|nr:ribonuclease H1 [Xylaria intraflava]